MLRKKLYGIVALGFGLMLQSAASAETLFEEGSRQYQIYNFAKAGRCFEAEIKANPRNAHAHYLLGNVFLELNRREEAAQEYRKALSIDAHGPMAQYCQQGLAAIDKPKSAGSAGNAHPSEPGDGELHAIQNSAKSISSQTTETESQISAEYEARIRDITRDTDRKIADLQREMQERIDSNGSIIRGGRRGGILYDPGPDNRAIKNDYQPQIDALKEEQNKKITVLRLSSKERQSAAEDSALTLDKEYVNRNHTGSIKLTPSGTNIFVRSYETAGEPSGNAVPVALPPAKKLPVIHK